MDLDDTLTPNLGMPPREFVPSPKLKSALGKATQLLKVGLCTGRDKDTVLKVVKTLQLNSPQIIEGGAKIIDIQGQILWVKYISFPSVNTIISLLQTLKRSFSIIVDGVEIVDKIPAQNLDRITAVLLYDLTALELISIRTFLLNSKDITLAVNQDRTGNTVYITHKEGTKAQGVQQLQTLLNISKNETIGVGDGNNDIQLLTQCGFKVAMGNSVADLKSIADYIAPSVKEDGMVDVIRNYLKI